MNPTERYNLIKKICESKNQINSHGQLPTTETDLQDEFLRFQTSVEPLATKQDSRLWQKSFFQNLVFGS